jgi:hypothetical protein
MSIYFFIKFPIIKFYKQFLIRFQIFMRRQRQIYVTKFIFIFLPFFCNITKTNTHIRRIYIYIYIYIYIFKTYLPLRDINMFANHELKLSLFRPRRAVRVSGGWDCQDFWKATYEGGKVVSTTHRPLLPPSPFPREYPLYSILLEAE